MLIKNGTFSSDDIWQAALQLHATLYGDAHSFATSSEKTFLSLSSSLTKYLKSQDYDFKLQDVKLKLMEKITQKKMVAILGGGIQGCVMALMFRKHGYDVSIYDKSSDVMNRASAIGEGKIHLGLVYSKDLTMKTGEHMMRSALRFSSYLDYLVESKINWDSLKSKAFLYLLPHVSLVSPGEFEEYAAKLELVYEKLLMENPELSYLGQRPPSLIIERSGDLHPMANKSFFQAQYESVEYALSPEGLKSILKEALIAQSVNMILGRVVIDVKRSHQSGLGQLLVSTNISEHNFDMVVNCLWEGRSAIDEKFGIEFNSGGNYRFKTGIKFPFMQEYKSLPSVTVVNGAFEDFVQYKERSGMYFSYYPVSRLGMTVNGKLG